MMEMEIETYGKRNTLLRNIRSRLTKKSGYITLAREVQLDNVDTHEEEM